MNNTLPGTQRLVRSWSLLMLMTLVSMLSAVLTDASSLAPLWVLLLVLASTGIKVHQVLMVYLNLRVSSAAWKGGFMCLLLVTLLLILAGLLAARWA